MKIEQLDHLVLTVQDIDRTIAFYAKVLGMESETFAASRRALRFGQQKINLHAAGQPFEPHAACPISGSADLCFITSTPMIDVIAHFASVGVAVEEGPVQKAGATGPIIFVYIRDPDGNLIEISNYR